jgi:hypothetical protein
MCYSPVHNTVYVINADTVMEINSYYVLKTKFTHQMKMCWF